MGKRKQPERAVQIAVIEHLKIRGASDLVFFAVPNGGSRNVREAANLKQAGARAGVSDLIFLHRGQFFCLELKSPGGRPTDAQKQFMREVWWAQGFAACVTGIDEAVEQLTEWGLLR